MSWVDNKDHYDQITRSIDPAIRLTTKDGWIWKTIAWILFIVTFGKFKREEFLTHYATTLGPMQAYPVEWPSLNEGMLVHEGRHTKQARWFGLGIHPWAGLPFMAVAYVLLFFPIGLALFRYLLELDADKAKWRYMLETGQGDEDYIRRRAMDFAEKVSGAPYGWSWPRKWVVSGFMAAAEKIITEHKAK